MRKNPIKILWLVIGFLAMGIGMIGVALPVLPTTPLDSFVKNRAMTLKTKFCILLPASAMLILAMIAMSNLYGRIFIVFLIIFKYVYFFTKIETVRDTTLVGE